MPTLPKTSETQNPPSIRHNPLKIPGFDASWRVVSSAVVNSGEWNRTTDLRVMNPLL